MLVERNDLGGLQRRIFRVAQARPSARWPAARTLLCAIDHVLPACRQLGFGARKFARAAMAPTEISFLRVVERTSG